MGIFDKIKKLFKKKEDKKQEELSEKEIEKIEHKPEPGVSSTSNSIVFPILTMSPAARP